MSNPGVYVLSTGKMGPSGLPIAVEDNIGESIHLHIGSTRFDFTIQGFLAESERLFLIVRRILRSRGIKDLNLDRTFFAQVLPLMIYAIDVRIESRRLADLRALTRSEIGSLSYIVHPTRLDKTPAWKFLQSRDNGFKKYKQFKFHHDNRDNLRDLQESIRKNGYPYDESYIVLFGNQPYIRDGLNRATALAHLYGLDHVIDVQVIYFRGAKWRFQLARELTVLPLARFVRCALHKLRCVRNDINYSKAIRCSTSLQHISSQVD